MRGLYPVGSRLPPERNIAEKYGVSRTIVREALLMLELQGTVDIRQGYGVYVTRVSAENEAEEEAFFSSDIGPYEMLQARQLLESNIAAFAAEMATKADIDEHQRGRGPGAKLQEHVIIYARTLGYPQLYFYSACKDYYERFGWQSIGVGLD